jgi:hypothetical protein
MKVHRLNISIPLTLKAKLDALRKQGTTSSGYIRALLDRELTPVRKPRVGRRIMLFDPANTRTQEESIRHSWEHEWSEALKASVLASAEAQGCTWFDVVKAAVDHVLEDLELDPEQYEDYMARFRFASAPFGLDPRLEGKDGAP